jgi:hypothetical protein
MDYFVVIISLLFLMRLFFSVKSSKKSSKLVAELGKDALYNTAMD